MTPQDLEPQIAEIRSLLESQLRIKGRSLDQQIARAGRLLPRKVRGEALFLAQANMLIQNPKLARMINQDRVGQAHRTVAGYLNSIDPKDRRKGRLLNIAGVIAFNGLLIAGLVIAILVWRGFV